MIIRHFVTADLEYFVTGYPNDYCNISNSDFPILIPDADEAERVADLANEQNRDLGMAFQAGTIILPSSARKQGEE